MYKKGPADAHKATWAELGGAFRTLPTQDPGAGVCLTLSHTYTLHCKHNKLLSWKPSARFSWSLDENNFDWLKMTPSCYESFLGSNRHNTKIKIISDNYKGANTVYTHSCPHKNNKKECFYVVLWKSENHIQVIIGKSFFFWRFHVYVVKTPFLNLRMHH